MKRLLIATIIALTSVSAYAVNEPMEIQDAFQMQLQKFPNKIHDTYSWYWIDIDGDGAPEALIDSDNDGMYQVWSPEGIGNAVLAGNMKKSTVEQLANSGMVEYATGNAINPML